MLIEGGFVPKLAPWCGSVLVPLKLTFRKGIERNIPRMGTEHSHALLGAQRRER